MNSSYPVFLVLIVLFCHSACKDEVDILPPIDRLHFKGKLPASIPESSGLAAWDGQIWTHNDGGHDPKLFQISPDNGLILHTVRVIGAYNMDWEDMAEDEEYLYIGDFGNNLGNRKDLKIYRVAKNELAQDTVEASSFHFTYPDQDNFTPAFNAHNFDCEAMIVTASAIFLFSKNHLDQNCRQYQLSKTMEDQTAQFVAEYELGALVTGAEWIPEKQRVLLLTYRLEDGYTPIVWFLSDYTGTDFFSGAVQGIVVHPFLQTEGLCHFQGDEIYISTEGKNASEEALYVLQARSWIP